MKNKSDALGVGRKETVERAAKTKVSRLTRELAAIELVFYGVASTNHASRIYELEQRRDDMVRAAVLQIHTSIDSMMNNLITRALLKVGPFGVSKRASAMRRILSGGGSIGFDMKLNLSVALGVMNESLRKKLMELNTLRNRCSHNHTLRGNVRQGKRPGQKKPPILNFRGHHLYSIKVFERFVEEYWDIWSELYKRERKMPLTSGGFVFDRD